MPEGEAQARLFEGRPIPAPARLNEHLLLLDPGYDRWRSEVLSEAAEPALQAFVEALVRPAPSAPMAPFLADPFFGLEAPRPASLAPVFDDGVTRVLRPAGAEAELHGEDAIAELASALRAPYASATDVRVELEIVRVDLAGKDAFETVAWIEIAARTGSETVQQNATWRVEWSAPEGADSPRIRSIRVESFEEVHAPLLFAELTEHVFGGESEFRHEFQLGVDDYHRAGDRLVPDAFLGGQGLAVGDLDGDGRDDVYVAQQGGLPNRLYLHRPDGKAQDVTDATQLGFLDNTRGALIVDVDGDGDQDLVLAVGPDLILCYNDRSGVFREFVRLAGPGTEDVFSISAADADGDGDLDLFACRYVQQGLMGGVPLPYHDSNNGASNVYWRNDGERVFTDATAEAGFDANNTKFSLAAIWEDFDDDGDPDLYVTNDFGRNTFYRNEGGHFTEVAGIVGADDMAASMGATCADYDLDGDVDVYVSNMFSAAGLRVVPYADLFMGGEHRELHPLYLHHARGNTLLANGGDGRFTDVTEATGVARGGWAWGAMFVDLDGNGLEDLYVPNGFVTSAKQTEDVSSFYWRQVTSVSPPDGTTKQEYRSAWASIDHMVTLMGYPWSGDERNRVYLNLGAGRFADVSACTGADFSDDSRAVAVVDWDDDGRLDLLLKNRTAPRLRLLQNREPGERGFLAVDLVGTDCNRDAIGARVVVELGERTLRKTLYAGDGYLAQSTKRLHFGLGGAGRVGRLTVRWPDGTSDRFEDVPADSRLRIVQGEGRYTIVPARTQAALAALPSSPLEPIEGPADRTVLAAPLSMAAVRVPSVADPERRIADLGGRPLLLLVWRSDSEHCLAVLERLQRARKRIEASGLRVVPVTADGARVRDAALALLAEHDLATEAGYTDGGILTTLELLMLEVFGHTDEITLPAGLLLDSTGELVVVYRGGLRLPRLLRDVGTLQTADPRGSMEERLSGGRWLHRKRRDLSELAAMFARLGMQELSEAYTAPKPGEDR